MIKLDSAHTSETAFPGCIVRLVLPDEQARSAAAFLLCYGATVVAFVTAISWLTAATANA